MAAESTPTAQEINERLPELDAITDFNWPVYADATLAGLAVLIPIPIVDFVVEEYFRRRMPRDIAALNDRRLSTRLVVALNRRRDQNRLVGCLLLPFRAIMYLFRNIFRTVLYALSVVDAADNLGYYWHRAFLINYALLRGHLDEEVTAVTAVDALQQTLSELTTNPLTQLAQQILAIWGKHVMRLRTFIRFARKNEQSEDMVAARDEMAVAWSSYRGYLLQVAGRYERTYLTRLLPLGQAEPSG
jgi:hypothetical protein